MTRIGVLTGGGDCPGLNGAIKWVVKTSNSNLPKNKADEVQVIGIRDGWKGLVMCDPNKIYPPGAALEGEVWLKILTEREVRPTDRYGGTILGTSRTNPFSAGNDRSALVMENIERMNLSGLVAIGGEDTLGVAGKLAAKGLPVVGIPKTIDKDLCGTDYTIGFDSAINVITDDVDKLRTTAGSHRRIFVVETMGRHAGHLSLQGGMAAGAYVILIPEYDFDMDRVNELLEDRRSRGTRYSILIVAEGAKEKGRDVVYQEIKEDEFKHKTLGGIGRYIAKKITEGTGLESRAVVLSHLQRGGKPSALDRRMARNFGIGAVNLIEQEKFGQMVAYVGGKYTSIPLADVVDKLLLVDVENEYDTQHYNGKRKIIPVM
ncbi:MAG: ATP-dependent 6-phosphofructokinase [Pseudomonadota bacterium]